MGRIYTIPFGQCFLKTVANTLPTLLCNHTINNNTLDSFSTKSSVFNAHKAKIWLPTNRSVLGLKDALKNITNKPHQNSLVIPQLCAFTDLLTLNPFALKELSELPPGISAIARLSLLIGLLPKHYTTQKKIRLATYLAQLQDECIISDVPMERLNALFESDRLKDAPQHIIDAAAHLSILTTALPELLHAQGVMTAAQRNCETLKHIATFLQQSPIQETLIIAGTTGTVPATRALMKAILALPNGIVVLPGLDPHQTDGAIEDSNLITPPPHDWLLKRILHMPSHPQHTLYNLCDYLMTQPNTIPELTYVETSAETVEESRSHTRQKQIRQLFGAFPLPNDTDQAYTPTLITADSLAEEARIITCIVRERLMTTEEDISIVTPNQNLTKRILNELKLYGITPNLSAGQPLASTPVGGFLMALARFIKAPSRLTFIHLAKHPLSRKNDRTHHILFIRAFEKLIRSKKLPWHGNIIQNTPKQWWDDENVSHPGFEDENVSHPPFACGTFLVQCWRFQQKRRSCPSFNAFLQLLKEASCLLTDDTLFLQNDGASALAFFDALLRTPPHLDRAYEEAFILLMEMAPSVHSPLGLSSRVRILGTLEARLNTAECIICASLNEGNWPRTPEADPYLSNTLRQDIGLPPQKRQQGLAAHDLCSSFYAKALYFTRSKLENGEMMLPSRLMTRMETYYGIQADKNDEATKYKAIANYLPPTGALPIEPPMPTPPSTSRPKLYFASHIEQLMRDPYAFYAKHILKLSEINPLSEVLSTKDKGQLFHTILDLYLKTTPHPNYETLLSFAESYFLGQTENEAPSVTPLIENQTSQSGVRQTFWWYRFRRIAKWWHDKLDKEIAQSRHTEIEGMALFSVANEAITLKSRADRLDVPLPGTHIALRLIDYKTGQLPSLKSIKCGKAPQLLVEAIIAENNGFTVTLHNDAPFHIEYWRLTGGDPAGECLVLPLSKTERLLHQQALINMLTTFQAPQTPYLSASLYDADAFFARIEEWEGRI